MMKVTRFYATEDGESRFDEVTIPVGTEREDGHGNRLGFSAPFASPAVMVVDMPDDLWQDWHHAPRRQLVAVLSGIWEVTTSDGVSRQWGPGEVFMPDDVTGKGHQSRVVEGPCRLLFVPLAEGTDISGWLG